MSNHKNGTEKSSMKLRAKNEHKTVKIIKVDEYTRDNVANCNTYTCVISYEPNVSYKIIAQQRNTSEVLITVDSDTLDASAKRHRLKIQKYHDHVDYSVSPHGGKPFWRSLFGNKRKEEDIEEQLHKLREESSEKERMLSEDIDHLKFELNRFNHQENRSDSHVVAQEDQLKQQVTELEKKQHELDESLKHVESEYAALEKEKNDLVNAKSELESKQKGLEVRLREGQQDIESLQKKLESIKSFMRDNSLYYPLFIKVFIFIVRMLTFEYDKFRMKGGTFSPILNKQAKSVYLDETGLPGLRELARDTSSKNMQSCFSRPIDETFLTTIKQSEFLQKVLVSNNVMFLNSSCSLIDRIVRLYVYSTSHELNLGCSKEEREFHTRAFELIYWYMKYFLDIRITFPNLMKDVFTPELFNENEKASYLAKEMTDRSSLDLQAGTVFDFETCGYLFGESWKNTELEGKKILPLVTKILA